MPASQTVKYHRNVDIEVFVEPIDDQEIYFTDDTPEFDLVIRNGTDRSVTSHEDDGLYWVLGVGEGAPDPDHWEAIDVEVDPGEEQRIRIGGEPLAFEGSGVVGITGVSLRGGVDHDPIIVSGTPPSRGRYRWLYTFRVWDRSNFEAIHDQPKKILRASTLISGGVLLVAALQLSLVMLELLV